MSGRIAIMQPYLLPYAGYFRLMVDVDAFVIGDVQQFPRRGWVHRNRLVDDRGQLGWLSLPLAGQPLSTRIADLAFGQDAALQFARNLARFRATRQANAATAPILRDLRDLSGTPVTLIAGLLARVAAVLGLETPILRQSDFPMEPDLPPALQIRALCQALGATQYVNAPGGRALYDPEAFRRMGLQLSFHAPYAGPPASILQRLADESPEALRADIIASARQPAP